MNMNLPVAVTAGDDAPLTAGDRWAMQAISAWWAERGHGVRFHAIRVSRSNDGKAPVVGIRSDMVNGMPRTMGGGWRSQRPARGRGK